MIGRKAALGGMLMVGARLITRLFDLATMLILARLLVPADFGLAAIAMTLIAIVEASLELPINQALLRLPSISSRQYDTAFTLSVIRGLSLATILIASAWPFARFYGDSRLFPLVCILSLGPAARGLVSPRLAEFQKQMSFWRDFVIELSGKLAGFSCGFVVAVATGSYWSIATGTVVYPVTMSIASFVFAPYRPRLTLVGSQMFLGFVGWMSAAQVISALNWQFERLLLGKLQSTTRLGLFTTANDLANVPMAALFGPIMRPLLAVFAHLREDRPQLAKSYQTACSVILLLGIPLLVGEALVAEPFIVLVLGDRWRGAAILLQWLSLSLIPGLFALPAVPLVMSFGKTELVLRRNLIELCVKLPLVLVGAIKFGFIGVIFARFVSETVAAGYSSKIVCNLTGLSVVSQVTISWRPLASAVAMAMVVLLCLHAAPETGQYLQIAVGLGVAVMCGSTVYCVTLTVLWIISGRPSGVEATVVAACMKRTRQYRPL